MPIQFSQVINPKSRGNEGTVSVRMINLLELGEPSSPVPYLFHSRERGRPFEPHPHAGFSAITYVLEDSQTGIRTRDSLGNDIVMGPGGICWTQAGSGVIHEETPADADRTLHGLQIFVNLSAKNKFKAPQVFKLAPSEVPEWRSDAGDRVRVVVGSFEGVSSPLVPSEPFTFLDVQLRQAISVGLHDAHSTLVYVIDGEVLIRAVGCEQKLASGHALSLRGSGGGRVTFEASHLSHFLILSGPEIHEPVTMDGFFMMNDQSQIEAAKARYQAGEMGYVEPLSDLTHRHHPGAAMQAETEVRP